MIEEGRTSLTLEQLHKEYGDYVSWMGVLNPIKVQKLGQIIKRIYPDVGHKQISVNGKPVYHYIELDIIKPTIQKLMHQSDLLVLQGMFDGTDGDQYILNVATPLSLNGVGFNVVFGLDLETNRFQLILGDKLFKDLDDFGIHTSDKMPY